LHTGMCRGCAHFKRQVPQLGAAAKAYAGGTHTKKNM